ncbi:8431_t:CDS:2 [Funneliformis geosporum]|uniref:763_t:CDS:1 n=1 Tax=Funneliformis geosporum TaxID=1117311 RepID=A0A9W4SB21_9GLOM|nr:763_t:CDS:2 [Funneliformis geosporum]CAI2165416.1 8431_t:CDS:2 [Funneliformis geosporum]
MLDENDGSDMELDSDTSLDAYHIYSNNKCSKKQTSQSSDENNDKSSDREQFPQRGEASLRLSNNGNDRFNRSGSYVINNPTKSQTALLTNRPSFKSPSKSFITGNGPRPLEKRERIKFELKSTGYKNKLQSANSNISIKNNSDASRIRKDNVKETQLFPQTNKSSFPSSLATYSSHNLTKKIDTPSSSTYRHDDSERKHDDKRALESNFKDRALGNLVTIGKVSGHSLEQNVNKNLSLVEEGSATTGKDNARLTLEHSKLGKGKGNDQQQKHEIDVNSVILEKVRSQEKNQSDNNDHPKAQVSNSEVRRERAELPIMNDDSDKTIRDDLTGNNSGDENDNKKPYKTYKKDSTKDQVIVLPDQDRHPNDDIILGIIGSNTSSENEINESDKSEKNNTLEKVKLKSKGKKVATPANLTSSSSKTIETEVSSQVYENISRLDHLAGLMTNLTNQICKTSQMVQPISQDTLHTSQETQPINQDTQLAKQLDLSNGQANQEEPTQVTIQGSQPVINEEEINPSDLSNEIIEKYRELDNTLSEFDKIAKKAARVYGDLNKLLPEGTMVKIDPPTTYKWDIITSMFGIADINKIEINQAAPDTEDQRKNSIENVPIDVTKDSNGLNVVGETSSEAEFDEEELDVLSDDPDDKNFKCRSTILRNPNPKRWHNTRSNRPPSANLRQRTRVDSDSFNIPTASITHHSPSKKKRSRLTPKRTLRTRKAENEDDETPTQTPNSEKVNEDGKPRRPGNGFSYFCGDICAKVRNEKLNISGTIAYAAEIWKKMSIEEKQPWLDRGAKSKIEYQEQINKWKELQRSNNIKKRKGGSSSKNGSSSKRPRND